MPAAVVTVPTVDALMAQHIERMRLEQATATQEADAAAERAQEELYTKEAIFLWQRGVYERRPSMQRTMRELLTLSCSVYLNAGAASRAAVPQPGRVRLQEGVAGAEPSSSWTYNRAA